MPNLSAPIWLVGYIVYNLHHGEFTNSREPEREIGLVDGAGESIRIITSLIVVYRKSESRKLDTSMFHHCLGVSP